MNPLPSVKKGGSAPILEHEQPLEFEQPAQASKFSDVLIPVHTSSAPMASPSSPLTSKSAPLSTTPIVRAVNAAEKVVILPSSARSLVSSNQEILHRPVKIKPTNLKLRFSAFLMEIHALRILPRSWGIRWRVWLLSTVASLIRVQRAASQGLMKRTLRRAAARCRRAQIVVASIDWPRMWAPVCHWLQQPWDPTHLRIPQSRLFEMRRRFSYKKL
jgi:hypothetical protein